jgi:mannose-6-phosphate isomerase-like protein (cupin superfamily)
MGSARNKASNRTAKPLRGFAAGALGVGPQKGYSVPLKRRSHMSIVRSFASLLVLVLTGSSFALAQAEAQEPALAIAVTDSRVNWGPCPAFMPEGCRLAVLHGDPGKPNADVWLKIPPNLSVAHHWHSSVERMVLVSGELEVAYDGQAPIVLKPGMYAYGPAKLPHTAKCMQGDACVLFIAFEGPVDAVPTSSIKQ